MLPHNWASHDGVKPVIIAKAQPPAKRFCGGRATALHSIHIHMARPAAMHYSTYTCFYRTHLLRTARLGPGALVHGLVNQHQ